MKWVVFVIFVTGCSQAADINPDISIKKLDRTIDLTSSLVKITSEFVLANNGKKSVDAFHWSWQGNMDHDENVAFIEATIGSSEKTYLRLSELSLETKANSKLWKIHLKNPLTSGNTLKIGVEYVIINQLEMFPKSISQKEKQLVLFIGNYYEFSPYMVQAQTTKIILPSSSIENYSKNIKPVSLTEGTLNYGTYYDIAPFTEEELSVHFENNNPFLVVTSLSRSIEVSMWGNIAIEEVVDIRHSGASLKGSFSRYEFQRENSGVASVKSFKTILPASASDVYYRDDIGNISTSALRTLEDSVELDLRPRFPLFGGWKTHYFIGYNVPSYEYLFFHGEQFALNMRLVDHIFDDMLVEDFELRIILPEGSRIGKFKSPFPCIRAEDGLHYTYLDTEGRPVVTINNDGYLTEKHIQDFILEFTFPRTSMIHEPLLLIAAFFLFFVLTIIYVRLDFAITKDLGNETKLKLAGVNDKFLYHQEKHDLLIGQYDEAMARLKTTKDLNVFSNSSRKITADLKTENQVVNDLLPSIKAMNPEAAERVLEVQKLDRTIREIQQNQASLLDKLIGGKINKQQYLDQDSQLLKRREETREKIGHLTNIIRS